jgi:hypothetical protein
MESLDMLLPLALDDIPKGRHLQDFLITFGGFLASQTIYVIEDNIASTLLSGIMRYDKLKAVQIPFDCKVLGITGIHTATLAIIGLLLFAELTKRSHWTITRS